MKCKVFKIHLQNEFDELKLNKFLANVELKQVFASTINEEGGFWSVLAFYEDQAPVVKSDKQKQFTAPDLAKPLAPATLSGINQTAQPPAPEPIVLTPAQENDFNALKKWRNERAAQEGIPPYLIAHNDSLLQIATMPARTKEELLQIKGFGEKRTEKYGDEIMNILDKSSSELQ